MENNQDTWAFKHTREKELSEFHLPKMSCWFCKGTGRVSFLSINKMQSTPIVWLALAGSNLLTTSGRWLFHPSAVDITNHAATQTPANWKWAKRKKNTREIVGIWIILAIKSISTALVNSFNEDTNSKFQQHVLTRKLIKLAQLEIQNTPNQK